MPCRLLRNDRLNRLTQDSRFSSSTHPILNTGYTSQSPTWSCRSSLRTSNKTTNLVAIGFRKPDLAIGPVRNATWDGEGIGHGELANLPRRRDAPDPAFVLGVIGRIVNKPEVAIRSSYDAVRTADKIGHWELTDDALRSNAPDLVVPTIEVTFGKPEIAVWPSRDLVGMIGRGEQGELADRTGRSDAPDYAPKFVVINCDKPTRS